MELILLCFAMALLGGVIYTVVGLIPGTDETASLAPLTLLVVLLGVPAPALLAWFIAAITAMETTNTVPAAIAAIPGSTMAVPFVPYCASMRKLGLPRLAMRKLVSGSLLGTLVAVPIAVFVGRAIAPLGGPAKAWAPLLFAFGAILIALLSRHRWASLLAIIPLSFLIQGLQNLGKAASGKPIFICIFMGIAVGPMSLLQNCEPPEAAHGVLMAVRTKNERTEYFVIQSHVGSRWRRENPGFADIPRPWVSTVPFVLFR